MKRYRTLLVIALVVILALSMVLVACNGNEDDKIEKFSVTFEGDGINSRIVKVVSGEALTEPKDPTREGYVFVGWRKKLADGTLEEENYDFSAKVTANFTLVAVWSQGSGPIDGQTYTVTLNPGEGTVENATVTVTGGAMFDLGIAEYEDHVFLGWMYRNELITDDTGKSLATYSYGANIEVVATFGAMSDNLKKLESAIENTGDNFSANFFLLGSNNAAYTYRCTENIFLKDYNSTTQLPEGYNILVDELAHKITFSLNDDGTVSGRTADNAYEKDGKIWGREDLYNAYYITHIIKADYFDNVSTDTNFIYKLKEAYNAEIASTLYPDIDESSVTEITVEASGNRLSRIMIMAGSMRLVVVTLSGYGSTSVDLSMDYVPFISQLPKTENNDEYETAPATFGYKGAEGKKTADNYDANEFVNGADDGALADLDAAIKAARNGVSYTLSDKLNYLSTSVSDGSSQNERRDSEARYKLSFDKTKRARIERLGTNPTVQYVIVSAGTPYIIDYYSNGTYNYRERSSWESYTLGGNIFNKINASMFKASADGATYTLKQEYVSTFFDLMFSVCTDERWGDVHLEGVYSTTDANAAPNMEPTSASITLNSLTGKIISMQATGVYNWSSGEPDTHTITITVDNNYDAGTLTMPFEWDNSRYNSSQIKLRQAVDRMNYYTLEFRELNTVVYKEYWGKDVIYQEYWASTQAGGWAPKEYGSSGWIIINGYGYVFELDNGRVDYDLGSGESRVPTEPYEWYDGEPYYRAYMYTTLAPLAQIDPFDFEWDDTVKAYKCVSHLSTYADDKVFGWYDDESYATGMYIFMDESGDYIDHIFFGSIKANSSGELETQEDYIINVLNVGAEVQYRL